jgi:hypothetical protein
MKKKTDGRFFVNYDAINADSFKTETEKFLKKHQDKKSYIH